MAQIPISGLTEDFIVPGPYLEINFAQGQSTQGAGARHACYVMPKLSSGSWQSNQLVEVRSEQDAIDGAGEGSPLHRALKMHLKCNRFGKLYALPYDETSGGSPQAADGYISLSGTATKAGLLDVSIAGEDFQIPYSVGDTGADVATLLDTTVADKAYLPCDPSDDLAGTVTLTAKIKGKSQGDGTTGVIRFRCSVRSGAGITVVTSGAALGLVSGTAGVDGSTTEADNLTTALATIDNVRKYYLGVSVWDATSLSDLQTHLATKALPLSGLRSVGVSAFTGTLAAAQALATARNYERLQLVWQPNSEHDVAELVGNMLALRQKQESTDSAYNFDHYANPSDWFIKSAHTASDWPDAADQNDALTDGVCVVASADSGSYIVMSVNTKSKNSSGTLNDRRALDTHRVSVCDEVADTLIGRYLNTFSGFKLKDDERLSDGSVNTNQKVFPKVLTPSKFQSFVAQTLRDLADGRLEEVQATIDDMTVAIDPVNGTRLEVQVNLNTIEMLHQTSIRVNEISSG